MWINENCVIIPILFSMSLDNVNIANLKDLVDSYTKYILYLARRTTVYLLLEPTPITTKIRNIKRVIVFPMLSSIVCDPNQINQSRIFYRIVEGVWAKVGVIFPYASYSSCEVSKAQDLGLEHSQSTGIPYICLDKNYVGRELGLKIINGGFIEVVNSRKNVGRIITIAASRDPLTSLLENITLMIKHSIDKYEGLRYSHVYVDQSLSIYVKNLVYVDHNPGIVKLGRGYVFALDLSDDLAQIFYNIILLIALSKPIDT